MLQPEDLVAVHPRLWEGRLGLSGNVMSRPSPATPWQGRSGAGGRGGGAGSGGSGAGCGSAGCGSGSGAGNVAGSGAGAGRGYRCSRDCIGGAGG